MTHLSVRAAVAAAAAYIMLGSASAPRADAQCATCPTPTVAFSPVVAAPAPTVAFAPVVAAPAPVVVATRMGLFDRWRLRRWGVAMPVTTVPMTSVAVAPTFVPATTPTMVTAGFAPTAWSAGFVPATQPTVVTAGFAPTAWTAGFAPVATRQLTAFAPLQRPVAQTAFLVAAPSACSSCAATTTSFSPVEVAAPACSACTAVAPCSSCATNASFVEQASYPAATPGCASCASSSSNVIYPTPAAAPASTGDPVTPPPTIDTPAAGSSGYTPLDPYPLEDNAALEAPSLLPPDQTANSPTVEIHTAVLRRPASATRVSTTAAKPVSRVVVDSGAWTTTSGR